MDNKSDNIQEIWEKAVIQDNNNPEMYRKDYAGAWIKRDQYGMKTDFGWVKEYIVPIKNGGDSESFNVMPVNWRNHKDRNDAYPTWTTYWSAKDNINEKDESGQSWIIE